MDADVVTTAHVEASRLLAEYGALIDAGDFAGLGALLSDAVLEDGDGNRIAAGADEIEALYTATTRRYEDGTPRTAHVITNVMVADGPDPEGVVEVRSRFTVFQATDGFPLQAVVVGRYVDHVGVVDGRWRFLRRRMVPELWGDPSRHLLFDPR